VVLAVLLGVLGACTLGHVLITSVRRRRRDLAVLKTLGFVPDQVSATVVWQATALVGLAVVAGPPLGLAAGQWSWGLFARQLVVGGGTVVPLAASLATIPAAVSFANLIAALPARAAARTRPAVVLRAE
jgi:ABC-type lipoprotein release transport system permease subunit